MPKYHISPNTGRPNICQAKIKECPIGGEHFDTKEQAKASIEKKAAEENSTVPNSLKKKTPEAKKIAAKIVQGQKLWNRLTPAERESLEAYLATAKKVAERKPEKAPEFVIPVISAASAKTLRDNVEKSLASPGRLHDGVTAAFHSAAEHYNPGCNGCQDPYDDYCRCGTYTGNFEHVSPERVGQSLASYTLNDNLRYDEQAREQVGKIFASLARHHQLADEMNYTVVAYGDYYGETLDRIDVNAEGQQNIENFCKDVEKILSQK